MNEIFFLLELSFSHFLVPSVHCVFFRILLIQYVLEQNQPFLRRRWSDFQLDSIYSCCWGSRYTPALIVFEHSPGPHLRVVLVSGIIVKVQEVLLGNSDFFRSEFSPITNKVLLSPISGSESHILVFIYKVYIIEDLAIAWCFYTHINEVG